MCPFNREITQAMTLNRLFSGAVAALAFGIFAATPVAAQKAPPKKTAKTAAKKTAKKKSPCQGLKATACRANKVCGWIVPKKKVDKRGRKLKPYCRKVAGIARKKKTAAKPKKK